MIEQIKQRWYKDPTLLVSYEAVAKQAKPDIEYLIGEVERLDKECDMQVDCSYRYHSQVEELQQALEQIANYTNPTGEDGREMIDIARQALERTKP